MPTELHRKAPGGFRVVVVHIQVVLPVVKPAPDLRANGNATPARVRRAQVFRFDRLQGLDCLRKEF